MPGGTDTPMAHKHAHIWVTFQADYREATGLPHLTPAKMGNALVFLCTDAAASVNGALLLVDDGYVGSTIALHRRDGDLRPRPPCWRSAIRLSCVDVSSGTYDLLGEVALRTGAKQRNRKVIALETLEGKVAVITGGGSGIGREQHSPLRAPVCMLRSLTLTPSAPPPSRQRCLTRGPEGTALALDVTKQGDFDAARDVVLERFGRLDIVMNNVGLLAVGRPEEIPMEAWEQIISTNLLSVVRSNAAFLPSLLAQGSGHIVNTASTAGLFAYAVRASPVYSHERRRRRRLRGARALPPSQRHRRDLPLPGSRADEHRPGHEDLGPAREDAFPGQGPRAPRSRNCGESGVPGDPRRHLPPAHPSRDPRRARGTGN